MYEMRVTPSILQCKSYHFIRLFRKIAGVARQQEDFKTPICSACLPTCPAHRMGPNPTAGHTCVTNSARLRCSSIGILSAGEEADAIVSWLRLRPMIDNAGPLDQTQG